MIDRCVINSKGELLVIKFENEIDIINRSGDRKTFCEVGLTNRNLERALQVVKTLAIDRHDNVFLIIQFKDGISNKNVYVLCVKSIPAATRNTKVFWSS